MKNILYTLLSLSLIFSACKKEDDSPNNSNSNNNSTSIVGVWTPTSVTIDTSLTTIIDGEIVNELDFGYGPETLTYSGSETITPEEADMTGTLEFTDNGQAIFEDEDDTSTYLYSNDVVKIIDDDGDTTELTCLFTGSDNLALTMSFSMDTSFNEPMLMIFGYPEGNISISGNETRTINAIRQ